MMRCTAIHAHLPGKAVALKRFTKAFPLVFALLCACSDAGPLRTENVCLVKMRTVIPLKAEVAITDAERARGLQGRDHLPADQAMMFVYPEPRPPENAFWMYKTRIPLTLAFFDKSGRIVSTHQMDPCHSQSPDQCPTYKAGHPHQGAIEVTQGLLSDHNIGRGAYLRLGTGPESQPCAALREIPFP